MKKILNFIISRSEHTRKIIAGVGVGIAGIMLFFAWSAGVSARLPLLGSEFDLSADSTGSPQAIAPFALPADARGGEQSQATAVSPIKGLIESFQDLMKLFHGDYPAAAANASFPASTTPIDGLFNKVGDEAQASSTQSNTATTTNNQPPIEDLPGL